MDVHIRHDLDTGSKSMINYQYIETEKRKDGQTEYNQTIESDSKKRLKLFSLISFRSKKLSKI